VKEITEKSPLERLLTETEPRHRTIDDVPESRGMDHVSNARPEKMREASRRERDRGATELGRSMRRGG